MNKNEFLECIKVFTEEQLKDMRLPVRAQAVDDLSDYSTMHVYKMRLPDSKAAAKKAPYVIHQIITSSDAQAAGERTVSTLMLRSIFCVYCDDEQEGSLYLLEAIERLRIALLRKRVLSNRFQLDLEANPLETLIYPEDTAPYYAGEMVSTWIMPSVEREVREWLQ